MRWRKNVCRYGLCVIISLALGLTGLTGCASYEKRPMIVTAYSSDKISTNWRRGWIFFWRAYVASGPNKGKRKIVGLTASGTKAKHGPLRGHPLLSVWNGHKSPPLWQGCGSGYRQRD